MNATTTNNAVETKVQALLDAIRELDQAMAYASQADLKAAANSEAYVDLFQHQAFVTQAIECMEANQA